MLFSLSGCACVAHVLRVRSATHARLSRFSTLALRLIISLFQTRSAPRPRLSRLLPFALWQDTSLQAKKQCSRRTTKHNFGCAFSHRQAVGKVLTYLCTFRSSFSSFSALAVCSLQVTSLQAKKQCSRRTTKHNFGCAFSLSGCGRGAHVLRVRSVPRPRLPRLVRLASRLANV